MKCLNENIEEGWSDSDEVTWNKKRTIICPNLRYRDVDGPVPEGCNFEMEHLVCEQKEKT